MNISRSRAVKVLFDKFRDQYLEFSKVKTKPKSYIRDVCCVKHPTISWKKLRRVCFGFGKRKDVRILQEPKGPDRILSGEEKNRLLEAVRLTTKSRHLEPTMITALNTGMRKGEIFNLKWPNLDFKTGVIIAEGTKKGKVRKIPHESQVDRDPPRW